MSNNKITLKKKIKGMIRLFRPELPLAAGICVIAGELLALGRLPSVHSLIYGFICIFLISGAALILNDYFDLEVDKVNAPDRPLPSGIVSPSEVIILTIIVSASGIIMSYFISIYALILSIILLIIGILYNWKLKETGFPGNLMVSISVASTFILGGISVGDPWNKIVFTFSSMAFFVDLGEEIAADAMDMEGDKKRNSKSIAILMGQRAALSISSVMFFLVVFISFIPMFFNWLGIGYIFMISISDIIIFISVLKLIKSKTPKQGHFWIKQIYRGAILGVLAFLVSRLFF